MSVQVQRLAAEPLLSARETVAARISRLVLLAICVGPIAVFPIGLACKAYEHLLGAQTPAAAIQTIEEPGLAR